MKSTPLLYAIVGAVLAAFGQVSLKSGAEGRVTALEFVNAWVLVGLILYAASTVLWILALSSIPLTAVYPFTALTYVLVNVLAVALLGERLSSQGLIGMGVVLFGLFLVATSLEVDHAPR
jgi:undecaprenyl phosphate-alpha-L-ara4N flippase subunit ArnE